MSEVLDRIVTLVTVPCAACGIVFAIPESFERKRREDGETFYCPNGHDLSWKESEIKMLQRRFTREVAAHDQTRSRCNGLFDEKIQAERSQAATKGHLTRIKKRVAHGVCPCCKRTFANLARHMRSKHPQYGGDDDR